MNWTDYSKLLDERITEAKYNLEYTEKKFKEAKMIYGVAVRGKEAFEKALDEKLGGLGK